MNERDLITARYSRVGKIALKVCPLCRQQSAWERYRNRIFYPVLSMELTGGWSFADCLLAAGNVRGLPVEFIGPLAATLYGRVGRGKVTLEEAFDAVQDRLIELGDEHE